MCNRKHHYGSFWSLIYQIVKHENLYITLDGVQLFVLHYTNKKTGCLLYLACGHLWYFPIMASSHKLNNNDFITNIDLNFVERIDEQIVQEISLC